MATKKTTTTTTKREVPEEKIFRTLVVCGTVEQVEEAQRVFALDLRSKKITFEKANNIVTYKKDRTILMKRMFLTPAETRRVIGRRFNELECYGTAQEHPNFHAFLEEIQHFKIQTLFTE